MKKEDKELLYQDLSSRFKYQVKGLHRHQTRTLVVLGLGESYQVDGYDAWFNLETVPFIPYLRPLSKMTEKEYDEFNSISPMPLGAGWDTVEKKYYYYDYVIADFGCCEELDLEGLTKIFNWLNSHYFDYHGLIGKGLALEAPEDMYGGI